jgi:hypothetical protein
MTVDSHARRGTALTVAAAITALTATLVLLFSAGRSEQAHAAAAATPKLSAKSVAFREAMNKLWEDHITWTRMVIVDFAAGLPDLQTAEARLLRNQADIGNAIKPYYGRAAGNKLTSLLRTHILEAVPVLQAAKEGDGAALNQALAAWHVNARQIAVFLARANPRNWPLGMMTTMMNRHLALTTAEAAARLQGDWSADVAAYDKVHAEILQMADMLSTGIIRQFPRRF